MCSVLGGAYAPIDTSDGSGMNLLDLKRCAGEGGRLRRDFSVDPMPVSPWLALQQGLVA